MQSLSYHQTISGRIPKSSDNNSICRLFNIVLTYIRMRVRAYVYKETKPTHNSEFHVLMTLLLIYNFPVLGRVTVLLVLL